MKRRCVECIVCFLLCFPLITLGLVKYDEGQRQIMGIQLLQDYYDPNVYYYIPQYPRLATKADGTFELLCIQYRGADAKASGGLLHALVEFSLPEDVLEMLEKELKKVVPDGRIAGPVPLMHADEEGDLKTGSFQVVSATLSDTKEGGFTRSVITSGKAPLLPGSKAVIAAILTQEGATLLWDSFQKGTTSDVSVSIHAYYEAAVQGYNATVTADVSMVYEHFSRVSNVQHDYTKRELRKIMDTLQQNGTLKVEVLDRSTTLGIKASDMESIMGIVTSKLTELMFDAKTGWAKEPEREVAVEANQIQGRQKRGWFSRVFGGAQDTRYFTDNQYVLKRREDIRQHTFSLVLSKTSTIKVPVDTAGNLGGLYNALEEDDARYFRIVNLADPAYERATVSFQIDGSYLDSFNDIFNSVSVLFRKKYHQGQEDFTKECIFTPNDAQNGIMRKEIEFPRLGMPGNWREYEYQVRWSVRNRPPILVPASEDDWIKSHDPTQALVPPFTKRDIKIEADRTVFSKLGITRAVVELAAVLSGELELQRSVALKATDTDSSTTVTVYCDREKAQDVGYRISWYSPNGKLTEKFQLVDSNGIIWVQPPDTLKNGGIQ